MLKTKNLYFFISLKLTHMPFRAFNVFLLFPGFNRYAQSPRAAAMCRAFSAIQ